MQKRSFLLLTPVLLVSLEYPADAVVPTIPHFRNQETPILAQSPFELNKVTLQELQQLFQLQQSSEQDGETVPQRLLEEIVPIQRLLEMSVTVFGENDPNTAEIMWSLAKVYETLGRYSEAEPLFQRAVSISEKLWGIDHPNTATRLDALAGLYSEMGRYSEAESLYQRSLSILESELNADHITIAVSLGNLAALYSKMGRYSDAEPLYQRSLSIIEQKLETDHPIVAASLNNLADLYSKIGRYSDAEPLYQRSLSIIEQKLGANNPSTAAILDNLATLYSEMGRYREAEPLFQRSLSIRQSKLRTDHPDIAASLNNLAELYSKVGRYSEAESLFQRSLSIVESQLGANHPNTATSLNNLARLNWAQDRFDQSLGFLARGLEVEETNILQNVATLTEAEQRAYLSTIDDSEDWIVSLHLQHLPNNPQASATALTTILRRKGRILDTLSNSLQRLRATANPEDLERLNRISQLHTQLTNLLNQGTTREQVQEIQSEIDDLQKQLAQNNPEFNPEPVTLEAIRSLLPTDAALIEFFQYRPFDPTADRGEEYGEPRYAAYILTPQGDPVGIDLGEASFIDQRLDAFRALLVDSGSTGRLTQISQMVHKLVIAPLQRYLGNAQHLLISPDGKLNLIPFAALQDPQGKYLLENYQLTALSSGRDLVRYQHHHEADQPPVIVAHPNYNAGSDATASQLVARATRGSSNPQPGLLSSSVAEVRSVGVPFPWSDLPGTDREADLIAPKLPRVLILKANQATEGAVKVLESPSILHFATHGFFLPSGSDNQNPLIRSGLILAGANLQDASQNQGEDGVLTALEVSGLDLRGTQMVVMSACDTGKGELANGEGVYGLRRAFTLAGAESQLFSLWEVNDWATQALLTRYYDYLLEGRGRSEAWRQTQLDMLRGNLNSEIDPQGLETITDTAHPNYWAAFVPAGNWEPLNTP